MATTVELLLLKTVENLGIVGDVVKVKPGFARNYLLPMGLAVPPSATKIEALKEARAAAQAELAQMRADQERIVQDLGGTEVTMERSCNDQGALYGSVTQRDISDALIAAGYGVDARSVRLSHPIRRIGPYHVPIQFDKELRADVTVIVKPDRELEGFDASGQPIESEEPETEAEGEGETRGEDRRRRREHREPEAETTKAS